MCYSDGMARKIHIICIGKAHDALLIGAITEYQKRIRPYAALEWHILPPKQEATQNAVIASESKSILKSLENAEYVILCDEHGQQMTSEQFSISIIGALAKHKQVAFVIGGAYGVDKQVKQPANKIVSFGSMVLPHQLMRLVLSEQIYRAFSIEHGNGYHHA